MRHLTRGHELHHAAFVKLGLVGQDNALVRARRHGADGLRAEHIHVGKPLFGVVAVGSDEELIDIEFFRALSHEGAAHHLRVRIIRATEQHHPRAGNRAHVARDKRGIRDNRHVPLFTHELFREHGAGRAGLDHDRLAAAHHVRGAPRNTPLDLIVKRHAIADVVG